MNYAEDEFLPWFESRADRFEQQKELLKARGFTLDEERLRNNQLVQFRGRLDEDPERTLFVEFPNAFPSVPPCIRDDGHAPLLQRHQDPFTRQFCLFGRARVRWRANMGAEEALAETANLIRDYAPGKPIPGDDEAPEPLTAAILPEVGVAALIPPDVSADIPVSGKQQCGTLFLRYERGGSQAAPARAIPVSLKLNGSEAATTEPFLSWAKSLSDFAAVDAVCLPQSPDLGELKQIVGAHFSSGKKRKRGEDCWLALLFPEQSGNRASTRLNWLLFHQRRNEPPKPVRTYVLRREDNASRLPNLGGLVDESVMIIGCGCLGSAIATALGATGVSSFGLVDCDTYEPNNAVRHQVGVESFGAAKAYALADRVRELNPFADIQVILTQIGGMNAMEDETQLVKHIAGTDLIINTTADHGVSRWLDEICFRCRVPTLHVSVTGGAWGGEIVRVVPGKTACWMCWGREYHDSAPPSDPSGTIFAPGCNQPSFTGAVYECAIIADLACSVAVSTLLSSEGKIPDFHGNYLRWSARDEHAYLCRAEVLPTHTDPACSLCYNFK